METGQDPYFLPSTGLFRVYRGVLGARRHAERVSALLADDDVPQQNDAV
jgi:hypothetical protein